MIDLKELNDLIDEYLKELSDDDYEEYYLSSQQFAGMELQQFIDWLGSRTTGGNNGRTT